MRLPFFMEYMYINESIAKILTRDQWDKLSSKKVFMDKCSEKCDCKECKNCQGNCKCEKCDCRTYSDKDSKCDK